MTQETPFSRIEHFSLELAPSLLPTCRLVLLIQPNQVFSVLISPSKGLIQCKEFCNTQGITSDMFLRFVFERETFLRASYQSCRIYTSDPLFTLIPDKHFQEKESFSISRLLLDSTVFPEELYRMNLPNEKAQALFAVSPPLLHLLDHYLSAYTIHHICGASIAIGNQLADKDSFLLLHLQDSHIMITVFKDGKLYLSNLYPFRSIPDALYFVQMARRVAGLEGTDIPLYAIGELGEKGSEQDNLWEYIPDMVLPAPLLSQASGDIAQTPYWRYAFLAF